MYSLKFKSGELEVEVSAPTEDEAKRLFEYLNPKI